MDNYPLVSVIVPAYNAERWLYSCCESVFRQTYPNIELIIVNDGSDDGTYDLAITLANANNKVHIINTENCGVSSARNTGLEAATGEYIVFLDADDLLIENALELLYSNLISVQADIAVGWKSNMTQDGIDLGCPFTRISGVFEGKEGLRLSLEDHPSMHAVWGKLYKREAIGDTRFIEGKRAHEDSFFVFSCLLKQPRVIVCDRIVLRYRFSENSASRSSFSDKFYDILYFANEKKAIIERNYPELRSLGENVIIKANMAVLWNILITNDAKYKAIERKAIQDILDRKQHFRPALTSDSKLFWLLTHRLYGLYKMLHIMKSRMFNLRSH